MGRVPRSERRSVGNLESRWIRLPAGRELPFSSVAEFEMKPGFSMIRRRDGQRTITVTANADLAVIEPARLLGQIEAQYLPGAKKRGMQLLHTWVTPPVELEKGGSRVVLVWQLDGVTGFWTMRSQNGDPAIARWWQACEQFVVSRTRRFAIEADLMPRLEADARKNA